VVTLIEKLLKNPIKPDILLFGQTASKIKNKDYKGKLMKEICNIKWQRFLMFQQMT
jgi:hypothetical protein